MSFGKITLKNRTHFCGTALFIVLMSIVTETNFSFYVVAEKLLFSAVAVCGVYLYLNASKRNMCRLAFRKLVYAAFPFMVAFLYTVILVGMGNEYHLAIIPQAFTSMCFAYVQMMFAGTLLFVYKSEAIDVVYGYIVGSYTITVVNALAHNRLADIITNYRSIENVLERNDIGTAVVPVILLYLYRRLQSKKVDKVERRRTFVMVVILLLCGKRSALVALAVAMPVMWLLSLDLKNKGAVCWGLSVATIGLLYAYVAAIKSGLLEWLCLKVGISADGRIYVWTWFNDQYELSLFYPGKGFQYVHKYMQGNIAEGGAVTSMVSRFGYLHNSVLQIFIELGFVGFLLWFGFYLVAYPNRMRKMFGANTGYLCVILMVCNVWMYMTDNTLTYPVYQSTLYVALFSYALRETDKRTRTGEHP